MVNFECEAIRKDGFAGLASRFEVDLLDFVEFVLAESVVGDV